VEANHPAAMIGPSPGIAKNPRLARRPISDVEGQEYDDLGAAKEEAETAAREILSEAVKHGEVIDGRTFEITDANGALCATLSFRDVLRFS
jgi:hypothetical protein